MKKIASNLKLFAQGAILKLKINFFCCLKKNLIMMGRQKGYEHRAGSQKLLIHLVVFSIYLLGVQTMIPIIWGTDSYQIACP